MHDGDTVRTGEIRNIDLCKLTYNLFIHLNLRINFDGVSVTGVLHENQFMPNTPYYEIQDIYLESRKGKDLTVEEWSFKRADTEPAFDFNIYEAKAFPSKDYDSLYLVVHYSEGLVTEKEIKLR